MKQRLANIIARSLALLALFLALTTVIRGVPLEPDPLIAQRLMTLMDEKTLLQPTSTDIFETSFRDLLALATPEGFRLKNRYLKLGITLSEALASVSDSRVRKRFIEMARWVHSPHVRAYALLALASIPDLNPLPVLEEALWDRQVSIRFAALEAFQMRGSPGRWPLLEKTARYDTSRILRIFAAQIMLRVGQGRDKRIGREILLAALEDRDWATRAMAAQYLGELGQAEDYDLLLSKLAREKQENEFVAAEMSIAALKLFPKKLGAQSASSRYDPRPPIKKPASSSGVLELEPLVITAPRLRFTQRVDIEIDSYLIRLLEEKAALRPMGEQILDPALTDLASLATPVGFRLKSRYTELGFLLAEGLAGATDPQLVERMIRVIREGQNSQVRASALVALSYNREPRNLGLIQELLQDQKPEVRFAALEALEVMGGQSALAILANAARMDVSPPLMIYAAQAAMRLGDETGKSILERHLIIADWLPRAMSMRYLGELGDERDYDRLYTYLNTEQNPFAQAELSSALLRLHAKRKPEPAPKKKPKKEKKKK